MSFVWAAVQRVGGRVGFVAKETVDADLGGIAAVTYLGQNVVTDPAALRLGEERGRVIPAKVRRALGLLEDGRVLVWHGVEMRTKRIGAAAHLLDTPLFSGLDRILADLNRHAHEQRFSAARRHLKGDVKLDKMRLFVVGFVLVLQFYAKLGQVVFEDAALFRAALLPRGVIGGLAIGEDEVDLSTAVFEEEVVLWRRRVAAILDLRWHVDQRRGFV